MTVRDGQLGLELFDDEFIQDPYPLYARMHSRRTGAPDRRFGILRRVRLGCRQRRRRPARGLLLEPDRHDDLPGRQGRLVPQWANSAETSKRWRRPTTLPMPRTESCWCRSWRPDGSTRSSRSSARPQTGCGTKECKDGSVEWMSAMANRLPMMIVGRLIGVPDVDIDQLVRWGYASTQVVEGLVDQDELAAAGVAVMELSGYINEHFQRAAADPQDNLLGDLATARALRRIGRGRSADDDDHAVQRRRRVHRVVDRVRRSRVGEPSRHPTAGARKP